jgi:DNA-binding MurR/RpiR family transcriptional regulator
MNVYFNLSQSKKKVEELRQKLSRVSAEKEGLESYIERVLEEKDGSSDIEEKIIQLRDTLLATSSFNDRHKLQRNIKTLETAQMILKGDL